MKVLIVEDELELLEAARQYMASENIVCESASSYSQASQMIHLYEYDCVVVDLNLPDGNGLDLIEELRKKNSNTGIIIISARNSLDDKLRGLELGSDDYLTKPFFLPELNARIKALLRRRHFDGSNTRQIGKLTVDLLARQLSADGRPLVLTKSEFDLFLFLAFNEGKVLSKESIAEHLLGEQADQSDSFDFIYSHMKNLRKKLAQATGEDPIRTVYGFGYKFESA
jgi:DNA-binding response OmpR family regulator